MLSFSAALLFCQQQSSMSHVDWGLLLLNLHRLLFTAKWDRWMAVACWANPATNSSGASCSCHRVRLRLRGSVLHIGVSDRGGRRLVRRQDLWAGRRSRSTSAAGRRVVVGARPHEQLRKLLVANFGETVEKKGAWKVHLGETSLGFRIHEQS